LIIPFYIGKNSNGHRQMIDLADTSVMMISYSEAHSLLNAFAAIDAANYPYKDFNYIIANSKNSSAWITSDCPHIVFWKDEPTNGSVESRDKLMKLIGKEILGREKIMKKKPYKSFREYFLLNDSNEQPLSYRFLLIDDVWDLVRAKPKSLSLLLIRVLLYGPAVGIHTIFASSISYRNLLQNLVNINPAIQQVLQAKYGIPEPTQINSMGQELIFTPDGLIYFKKDSRADLLKLYS
jgi:hypothetical protein